MQAVAGIRKPRIEVETMPTQSQDPTSMSFSILEGEKLIAPIPTHSNVDLEAELDLVGWQAAAHPPNSEEESR